MSAQYFVLSMSLAALLAAGCGGVVDPSENQVETFSGIVAVRGADVPHNFNVSKNGEMSVRLTRLSPTPSAVVGTLFGQPVIGGCSLFNSFDFTGLNRDIFQGPIQKGSYCIQVYDSGNLTVAQEYTIQVSHP